jgi:hypothetical protein
VSPARGHSSSLTERARRPREPCRECRRWSLRGASHAAPFAPTGPDPDAARRFNRPGDDRAGDHGARISRTDDGATSDVDSIAARGSSTTGDSGRTDVDDHAVRLGRADHHLKHVDGVRRADDDVIERAGEH